jgi:hypothetical protein
MRPIAVHERLEADAAGGLHRQPDRGPRHTRGVVAWYSPGCRRVTMYESSTETAVLRGTNAGSTGYPGLVHNISTSYKSPAAAPGSHVISCPSAEKVERAAAPETS